MSETGEAAAFSRKYLKSNGDISLDAAPLSNGGFLRQSSDILFQEYRGGGGGVGGSRRGRVAVDAGRHLAAEIKGHFEKAKINVCYQFGLLEKSVTFQQDTF